MPETVISLQGVSKSFPVLIHKKPTALSRASSLLQGRRISLRESRIVLDAISLEVSRGEVVGIIGKNAVGKTTLLQIISGIMPPDTGTVDVQGRVVPLFTLGAAMKDRLSVMSNIALLCAFFGMNKKQIEQRLGDIIAFGQLEDVLSMRVSQLSQGFRQRVPFAVAVHTQPDILLLDEVFTAGDAAFRVKAGQKMQELLSSGTTVVMVSHDMKRIEQFADRVLWIEEGVIIREGLPHEIVKDYMASLNSPAQPTTAAA